MSPIPRYEYGARLRDEPRSFGFWRDVVSELVATFLFVVLATLLREQVAADGLSVLDVAIGVAFLWAALGYGLGDFGGAHMNSAITFAMMIRGEVIFIKAILYWVFQTAGALCGYYFVNAMAGVNDKRGFSPDATLTWWKVVMVEACVTLVLCLAALGTGNIPRKGYIILQSIPVGLAAGMGTLVAYKWTGACMSPTQALGYQLMLTIEDETQQWDKHWYYWAGPFIGAALAAILYWVFDVIERPGTPGIYNTWTYGDGKRDGKNSSRENLTPVTREDDEYRGRAPVHHGYSRY